MNTDKLREEFEYWFQAECEDAIEFVRVGDGYADKSHDYHWVGYQAGKAAQSEWVSKLQSDCVDCINELESYVNAEYPPENLKYPHLKAKYLSEMESLGERLTTAKGPSE